MKKMSVCSACQAIPEKPQTKGQTKSFRKEGKRLNVDVQRCAARWVTWRAAEVNEEDKEREGGIVRSSLSSAAVKRTDALELPGTNSSSSSGGLFLGIAIFQKELFIAPPAKYNKKRTGSGMDTQVVTIWPCVA